MHHLVIAKVLPGIEEALAQLPSDWTVWIHEGAQGLSPAELAERLRDASGFLAAADRVDAELLAACPKLRIVSNYGVGVDNIDLAAAKARGVTVTNLPHEVTYSTAELAMALLLACGRRIVESDRYVRGNNPFTWTPYLQMGWNLQGKTLGLIGFGRIGQKVASMGRAFDMKPIYYSRNRNIEGEKATGAERRELDALLEEADVVSLHVPATPETRHLINKERLARMKPEAILINTARGAVVDEGALVDALRTGALRAAGLDVYEKEPAVHEGLLALDNVVLTPHVGTSTWDARTAMTVAAVQNLKVVLTGGEPKNRVV